MESNYFDIFDLDPSFAIDQKLLKQRYFALSKRFHPDFNIHLSEEEQGKMLIKTGEINNALKVLQSEQGTIRYLLSLYGYIKENKKDQLPPDFLMEMMDLNEMLMELELGFDREQFIKAKSALADYMDEIKAYNYSLKDRQPDNLLKKEWIKLKENYLKSRYLLRIKEKMNTLALPKEKDD